MEHTVEMSATSYGKHRFSEPTDESDVVLVVGGEPFYCQYSILKMHSPVFKAMFGSHFKEGIEKRAELPEKDRTAFIMFLNLMYPLTKKFEPTEGRNSYIVHQYTGEVLHPMIDYYAQHLASRSTLINVLNYVDEYQTESVKVQVDLIFAARTPLFNRSSQDALGVIQDLRMAELYGLRHTRALCTKWLCEADGWADCLGEDYKELSVETKYEILTEQLNRFHLKYAALDVNYNIIFEGKNTPWGLIKHLCDPQYK